MRGATALSRSSTACLLVCPHRRMHTTSLPETSDNFTAIHTPFVSTDSARRLADGSIRQVELLESRWFTGILTYCSRGCFSSWTFVSHSKPKWLPVCYDDAMANVKATNQRYSNTITHCIESTKCSDINVDDESNVLLKCIKNLTAKKKLRYSECNKRCKNECKKATSVCFCSYCPKTLYTILTSDN